MQKGYLKIKLVINKQLVAKCEKGLWIITFQKLIIYFV